MADSDLLSIFRAEASEYLEILNNALLQIEMIAENDSTYRPLVVEMNRIAHSLKGAARSVGFRQIETIAHYMEEVFNAAMQRNLALRPAVCDTLYDSLDLIQNALDSEESDTDDDETDEENLALVLSRLEQIVVETADKLDSQQVETTAVVQTEDDDDNDEPAASNNHRNNHQHNHAALTVPVVSGEDFAKRSTNTATTAIPRVEAQTLPLRPPEEYVRVTVSKLDRLMAEATELVVARMHGDERQRTIHDLQRLHNRWQREWRSVRASYIRLVRRMQDQREEGSTELTALFRFLETNQRYLTETNRRLAQLAQTVASDNLHLATLADQLQDDISGMRLVPFDTLVGGYQRMVRDLARDTSKRVQIEVYGAFVEIDKTVLEALKDPIMHLVRNAVDHGLELPEVREKAGKSPVGRVIISVEQRGSEIILRVSDDGKGIDPQRVRQAILKNRLLSPAEVAALSDDEVRFFVFHAGLSTSDTVTAISGRGMGMDIVRERVESLRGRISLHSVVGEGTTITVNVPVSLTRLRCILARIGDQQFAVPSVVVTRMSTIPRSEIFTAEGREMVVINDQPTPLVSLGAVLNVSTSSDERDEVPVMVLAADNRVIAFEVDELFSEQELVLKPLGPEIARARYVSGAALLGTGQVIIVLDSNDLVRGASGNSVPRRTAAQVALPAAVQRKIRVLIVDDSITTRTLEKNILETAGFEVQVAVHGLEAWSMLPEYEFDVVISDVEMPHMTGLELTTRIKQSERYSHLPVILLTSLSKPEQREAGLRAGADAYLVKSNFEQADLLDTIQSVL
jgi:two-component system, chemotaxis family, sensor kinase CheA